MQTMRTLLTLVLGLCCLRPAQVLAEGSVELDAFDGAGSRGHDQSLMAATRLFVDVVAGGAEKICWHGRGTLTVRRPDNDAAVTSLSNDTCAQTVAALNGAYRLALSQDQFTGAEPNGQNGTRWDVRVCSSSTDNSSCLNGDGVAAPGRLWARQWSLVAGSFDEANAINGSVYAVVPGGAPDRDAVIEMQMRGVAGYIYTLSANSIGPESQGGERVGRSTPRSQHQITPEHKVYLNPPRGAQLNWIHPDVSAVQLGSSCGDDVLLEDTPGVIRFSSNVIGTSVVICDVNRDGIFDLAADDDFSGFGDAIVGENSITWSGKTNALTTVPPGEYSCVVRLNVGEFHYIAEDIETAFPGIRMYRLEPDRQTRSPVVMWWDDRAVRNDTELMPNGQVSPSASPADGLDPQAYGDPAAAFYYQGGDLSAPEGNARAWGDFVGGNDSDTGKGNNAFLDQFAAADSDQSAPFLIRVLGNADDADGDGLSNARECELSANPYDSDTDGDGVSDGFEATATSAPNTDGDGLIDILDPDDDGDGVPTRSELGLENGDGDPSDAANSDHDGAPDYLDADADDDGVDDGQDLAPTDPHRCQDVDADGCDDCLRTGADGSGGAVENDGLDEDGDGVCDLGGDQDMDGQPDYADLDDDGDGIPDDLENLLGLDPEADHDGDGIPNYRDADDRGDGMGSDCRDDDLDGLCERPGSDFDQDGDGLPNHWDLDADGDGLNDALESGYGGVDADGDGQLDGAVGKNGLTDQVETFPDSGQVATPIDSDGDGLPNFLDPDDDNDRLPTSRELDNGAPRDTDKDGTPDHLDTDDDGDGRPTSLERRFDLDQDEDGDGVPDHLDADGDSDGDGLTDTLERDDKGAARDTDGDGRADAFDDDDDGDGVPTADELDAPGKPRDSDDDGLPDHLDPDDDGDGVPTQDELDADGAPRDTDGDGLPDHLDTDDDGDGVPTADELGDLDHDGYPDYLEPPPTIGLAGGARCSISRPDRAPAGYGNGLLALSLAALWLRRHKRGRGRSGSAR